MRRLDLLIGDRHWLSVGNYKESLTRSLLSNKIPKRFEVGTGFVLSIQGGERKISRQIDVLVWDSYNFTPIFREGEFVIIPPEACRAAIEVKGNLDHEELASSL